jgi:hypothetical protein
VLDELGLVLAECGADGAALRLLGRLADGLPGAGAGAADVAACQRDLVRELPALAAAFARRYDATGSPLFRLGEDMPGRSLPPSRDSDDTLVAVPAAAQARLAELASRARATGEPGGAAELLGAGSADGAEGAEGAEATAALARVAGRLVSEQRALLRRCRAAAETDPRDPGVRAVADRQALLLLAGAVLGVQGAAADGRSRFLGGPYWALLATTRIAERLGVSPEGPAGPAAAPAAQRLWEELDARDRRGVDTDVYATRLLW